MDPFDYLIMVVALLVACIPVMVVIGAISDGIVSIIRALRGDQDTAKDDEDTEQWL